MKAERLLETDVGLTKNPDEPQILIYHTHASETYAWIMDRRIRTLGSVSVASAWLECDP